MASFISDLRFVHAFDFTRDDTTFCKFKKRTKDFYVRVDCIFTGSWTVTVYDGITPIATEALATFNELDISSVADDTQLNVELTKTSGTITFCEIHIKEIESR